jgi:hypothetical protein
MRAVLGEHGPQVTFAEDQDAVGELSSGGQYDSFGEAVRSRTSGRDPHRVDARVGQNGVERSAGTAIEIQRGNPTRAPNPARPANSVINAPTQAIPTVTAASSAHFGPNLSRKFTLAVSTCSA